MRGRHGTQWRMKEGGEVTWQTKWTLTILDEHLEYAHVAYVRNGIWEDPTKEWKFDKSNKLLQTWNYTHRCRCMLRHSLRDSDYLKKARKGEDYWERNVEERKVVNESKLGISLQSIKSTWCSIQAAILMSNMMMLSVSPLLSSYLLSIHSLNFHELSILRECPKQFRAIINGRGDILVRGSIRGSALVGS